MNCSFTLKHYREILEVAICKGYQFLGFHEEKSSKYKKIIYLRHDIDVCIEEAIDMATLESELGIRSTYLILINSPLYNPLSSDSFDLISYIQEKGHWIGLHIDPLLITKNNLERFEEEIVSFYEFFAKKIKLVPVISFHRPIPELMERDFDRIINTYSNHFFKEIKYISDSRRMWREGCACNFLRNDNYDKFQILIHPVWWKDDSVLSIKENLFYLMEERNKRNKLYLSNNIEPFSRFMSGEI